jgi:hypothetical protein
MIQSLNWKIVMECPACKLINPANTVRCDCGYNFSAQTMRNAGGSPMVKHIKIVAWFWLFVGLSFFGEGLIGITQGKQDAATNRVGALVLLIGGVFSATFFGLLKFKPWALFTSIIVCCVSFVSPLSWYFLWALTRPETKRLFQAGQLPPPLPH